MSFLGSVGKSKQIAQIAKTRFLSSACSSQAPLGASVKMEPGAEPSSTCSLKCFAAARARARTKVILEPPLPPPSKKSKVLLKQEPVRAGAKQDTAAHLPATAQKVKSKIRAKANTETEPSPAFPPPLPPPSSAPPQQSLVAPVPDPALTAAAAPLELRGLQGRLHRGRCKGFLRARVNLCARL